MTLKPFIDSTNASRASLFLEKSGDGPLHPALGCHEIDPGRMRTEILDNTHARSEVMGRNLIIDLENMKFHEVTQVSAVSTSVPFTLVVQILLFHKSARAPHL